MKSKIIHWLIMPCAQSTLYIEELYGGQLSWKKKIRLKIHLKSCKWCKTYFKKASYLDFVLKKSIKDISYTKFNDAEIQRFKDDLKHNFKI